MNNTVIDKLRHYCRYQPRSHQDVRNKLYDGFKLHKQEAEALLADMIVEGLVCEENFAKSFAHDRHRLNGWGMKKIEDKLKQRQLSGYCIKLALLEIDSEDYNKQMGRLAEKKWDKLQGKGFHHMVRKQKVMNYLLQKGYRSGEAWEKVRQLN